MIARLASLWVRLWMSFASTSAVGRIATRLATWGAPPYRARRHLARLNPRGYVAPSATIVHRDLRLGRHIFIGDRVVLFQAHQGGWIEIGDGALVHTDACLETGDGGTISIGAESTIHARCTLTAYKSAITIGRGVALAPNCALYPYDHGIEPGRPIREQPLSSRGPIVIDDEAWLGANVTVLSGVRIGKGAVVGAGSVVTRDVPDGAIVAGSPARLLGSREQFASHLREVAG
jgi:acetyltransferase-like isoleucine patch superfamily enzyme